MVLCSGGLSAIPGNPLGERDLPSFFHRQLQEPRDRVPAGHRPGHDRMYPCDPLHDPFRPPRIYRHPPFFLITAVRPCGGILPRWRPALPAYGPGRSWRVTGCRVQGR